MGRCDCCRPRFDPETERRIDEADQRYRLKQIFWVALIVFSPGILGMLGQIALHLGLRGWW